MSTLKATEKTRFEELFGMATGYVMDFSNSTFADFFRETVGVDIYAEKYADTGESKARRLRSFWAHEPDALVGKLLAELLEYWGIKNPEPSAADARAAESCAKVIGRLVGRQVALPASESAFLGRDLGAVSLAAAVRDADLLPILETRFAEATRCLRSDAPLATIMLCGSILEGLLLAMAYERPEVFGQAAASPRDDEGKVKNFQNWKLAEFIDVACDIGCLTLDIKKFSHALRDFRNYIHPYQQMKSRFSPDRHTAEICLQVLKAAVACLSRQRP